MTHRVGLADGRSVSWAVHGPADGIPVVFVAGAASGKSMSFGDDDLDAVGVRLVTVDRPGMGDSTPDPSRTLTTTADDLAAVVEVAAGRPVPVVANSQGAPFAVALALTGRVSHLVLVSPADEDAHPDVYRRLSPPRRAVVDQVRDDPEGARRFLSGLGVDGMETMVVDGSDEDDRAVYTAPVFAGRFRRALTEGFANDGAGYATDTLLAMSPWGLDLAAVDCPVTILFGERDWSHSPDQGAELAQRFAAATRSVVAGAGGSLLWTNSRGILDLVG